MIRDDLVLSLVRRAAAGDASGMECLLLRYDAQLLKYIDRRLPQDMRRVIDPQDILQDVHFEVFRVLRDFSARDVRAALHWLVRIARNRLIDAVRSHNAAKRGADCVLDPHNPEHSISLMLQDLAVYERTPSRSALAHELLVALQQSLLRLPADYQRVLQLRYMEGMSVEDAAVHMGRTDGAIRMLCNRGLTLLRDDLQALSLGV